MKQSKIISFVVEKVDKELSHTFTCDELYKACEGLNCKFWFILHNNDTDDLGTLKRPHYHVVCKYDKRVTKGSAASELQELLCCSSAVISSECVKNANFYSNLRYLTHIDDLGKFQYSRSLVYTNCRSEFTTAMDGGCTFDRIVKSIECNDSLAAVIYDLGIDNYKRYRAVIGDLWKELKTSRQTTSEVLDNIYK